MARLFPLLPFQVDETHWSWAARMAAFHIRGSVNTFLRDLGLDPFLVSLGQPDEVTRLCDLAGQDPETVLRNTPIQHIRRVYRLGDETLIDSLRPPRELRFCPVCLAEDDAATCAVGQDTSIHRRERLIWRLKPIRICPAHALPLIRRDRPDGSEETGVFGGSVPETTSMLKDIAVCAEPCPKPPLQTYIAVRIGGRSGPAWLDDQPLEQAIRATKLLGTALAFGPYTFIDDLSNKERDAASVCGWRFTSRGERGIRRAFRLLQARGAPKGLMTKRLIQNSFGNLLDDAHYPGGHAPIRRLLKEHIARLSTAK